MAVRDVYVAGSNGIGYTKEVTSSADYASIANDTYFKDLSLGIGGLILYKDSSGNVLNIFSTGGGGGGTVTSVGLSMPSAFSVANSPVTGSAVLTVTGTGTTADYIRGDGSLATFPTGLPTSEIVQDVKLGEAIPTGYAVYVFTADGTNIIVKKASNDAEATSSKTLGLLVTGGALNFQTTVLTNGKLSGLNTSTATIGDAVWLGTGGQLLYGLINKPYAPAHLVYIGVVTRVNGSNGEIFVSVQNGFELDELHNVDARNPLNNDGIFYNTTTSLWEHKSISTVLGYTPENVANKSTSTSLGTSDTLYPTQNAVKTYTDNILGNANALIYKGVIDCSTNPNYPAADAGWLYITSVAGKIGGASGISVEVGDMIICNTDGTVSGDQAAVGIYWNVIQKNIVGAVTGPASSINNTIPVFDGTTGKIIKQGIIQDNGSQIGIGGAPTSSSMLYIPANATVDFGIYASSGKVNGTGGIFTGTNGVKGEASSNGGSGVSTGLYGYAYDNATNVGVYGYSDSVNWGPNLNIGGRFTAINAITNYAVQLQDGTESVIGRFLKNITTDGHANWATLTVADTGLTLTTTGTSGAATLTGNTLNIPQYTGGTSTFDYGLSYAIASQNILL